MDIWEFIVKSEANVVRHIGGVVWQVSEQVTLSPTTLERLDQTRVPSRQQ